MEHLIRNCAFRFACPRDWDQLQETEEGSVRFCNTCESPVYLCETDAELRRHMVTDHCVAIPLRLREQRLTSGAEGRLGGLTMGVLRNLPEDDE